jgi:hypothetical protein
MSLGYSFFSRDECIAAIEALSRGTVARCTSEDSVG